MGRVTSNLSSCVAFVFLLGPIFFACGNPMHANPTNGVELLIARMYVSTASSTFTLLDLHRAATERLRRRYPDFRTYQERTPSERMIPSVSMQTTNRNAFVKLRYGGGLGGPFWQVSFSENGIAQDDVSGVGKDQTVEKLKENK